MIDEPWYRRMLGPTSLSWQAIVFAGMLNFPQMVLTGGNLGARTVQPDEYPTIAAISAATILVSFAYGFTSLWTVFRNRRTRPVSLTTFLTFYAGGGLLYSLGIQVSDAVAGSPSSVPFALRAIDAMLVSIAWGIGVALILEGRLRFHSERDALVQELLAETERTRAQNDTISRGESHLSRDILDDLDYHLAQILAADQDRRTAVRSVTGVHDLAQRIDSAADVAARQASHRAWEQSMRVATTPGLGRTLGAALATPRVWPAPMAVLVAIGVPTVAVRNFGVWWGIPAAVTLGLLTWWWMRWVKGAVAHAWPRFLLAFTGTTIAVGAFAILPAPITPASSADIAGIIVGLLGGFALVSFLATLQSERNDVLLALRDGVLLSEAERLAEARAVAQVARHLHGPVQTRLRICAAEIERAADSGDDRAIDAAVGEAMRALVEVTQSEQTMPSLAAALHDVVEMWEGFVQVDVQLDDTTASLSGRQDIVEIVNEAIANAHHHGQATTADVRITSEADGFHVIVTDNGSAEGTGEPGLGTRLLRSATISFDLTVSPTGARLQAVFPSAPR